MILKIRTNKNVHVGSHLRQAPTHEHGPGASTLNEVPLVLVSAVNFREKCANHDSVTNATRFFLNIAQKGTF